MEGRRAHAVAHLAYARSQKSGTGILGSKRVLQGGEKSSPLSVLRDLWLVYGVYGLDGEKWKHGPGSKTAGLGQTLVAGSVVQGEKPRVWVKPGPAAVWSRERNRGFGSSLGGGKCGPGSKTAGLGQALVAGSVVQGAKSRVWVKPWWREMWSRERNCGFGPSLGGGKCGPGRETAGLGQTLVAGNVVQGEKLRVWAKPGPAAVWSREKNRGPGSTPAPPECGPGSKTAAPGQARPRRSVAQGEKSRVWVKPWWREMWSRERNRGPGSNLGGGKCGPGSKTAPPGQTRPRPSVVQGEKPRPWVKPSPARVWSRERNCAPGSTPAPPECGPGRKTAALGQPRPRRSVVQGAKPRPRVKPGPAAVWSREQNRGPGSTPAQPKHGPRT